LNAKDFVDDISRHEGCCYWLYCDLKGFVTVGIGNLVRSPDHAASLPFEHDDGAQATAEEKRSAYIAVQDAFRPGLLAKSYSHLMTIRMTLDFAESLLERRLTEEFLPALARIFHRIDSWPMEARRAVVDMAYSLGINGLVTVYPKFIAACYAKDWSACAKECHRAKPGENPADPMTWGPRNSWTREMFLLAAEQHGVST
jgi:GH24 family phage-related lysozyme (muramidase)